MTNTKDKLLIEEMEKARAEVVKSISKEFVPKNVASDKKVDGELPQIPDNRNIRRAKERKLAILDKIVSNFMEFRLKSTDPDGQVVADRLGESDKNWKRVCDNHNKRKKYSFTLRHTAFMERVEHFIDLEAKQLEATKKAFYEGKMKEHREANKWLWRWLTFKAYVYAVFTRESATKKMLRWYKERYH